MKDAVPQEHKASAPVSVGCFVLTMSDSKTPETDTSGALIRELLTAAGHRGLQAPYDAFWGARYAVVEDPDGIAVGLMSPKSAEHRSPAPEV